MKGMRYEVYEGGEMRYLGGGVREVGWEKSGLSPEG